MSQAGKMPALRWSERNGPRPAKNPDGGVIVAKKKAVKKAAKKAPAAKKVAKKAPAKKKVAKKAKCCCK